MQTHMDNMEHEMNTGFDWGSYRGSILILIPKPSSQETLQCHQSHMLVFIHRRAPKGFPTCLEAPVSVVLVLWAEVIEVKARYFMKQRDSPQRVRLCRSGI